MVDIDDYIEERECIYKDERYSVRDNGAVKRHAREGKRIRKDDDIWTFGKANEKTGYMEIAGVRVHRIVAYAFHGEPPTELHVVDHVDTNRRNNRPENLRWLTRLENVLNNPITRAKIEKICGSVEAFLSNPSLLRGYEHTDPNFSWMRAVTPEEARNSLERLNQWAKEMPQPQGGSKGEWLYKRKSEKTTYSLKPYQLFSQEQIEFSNESKSLTPNAIQINWRTPTEFLCCPEIDSKGNPLEDYYANLKREAIFCKNRYTSSVVLEYALSDDKKSLFVMCEANDGEAIKPWSLTKITYQNGLFYHESEGTFFEETGARKHFTLALGKEWHGGDSIDDYC